METPNGVRNFDVTADGTFIGLVVPGQAERRVPNQLIVVLNWFEELKARVPTN